MRRVELPIRSPTATPWLTCSMLIIGTGELYYEIQKSETAQVFSVPFNDEELLPFLILLGVASILNALWLAALYCFPGQIIIDPDKEIISRRKVKWVTKVEIKAPIKDWDVEIQYFNEKDLKNKKFKKIILNTKNFSEVLLFTDLKRGEALIDGFSQFKDQMGNYVVKIEEAC